MHKKIIAYFKNHVSYNSAVHFLIGMGVGILFTFPYFGVHPVRWGIGLIALGLIGHLYPLAVKK